MGQPDDDDTPLVFSYPSAPGGGKARAQADDDDTPLVFSYPTASKKTTSPEIAKRTNHASDADVPDLSLSDVASGAAHNFGKDFVETAKGVGEGVMHPIKTLGTISDAITGAGSKALGAMGVEQDPAAKEQHERVVNALIDHYKDRYGSVKKIKNTVATHPVGTLMDVATPFSMGTSGAAKMVGEAGMLGKTLATTSRVAGALDPVSASVKLAGKVASLPNKLLKPITSVTASVPKSAIDLADAAGKSKDPVIRDASKRHFNGEGDAREIVNAAQDALEQVRQESSDEYGKTMAGQAASAKAPDYTDIQSTANGLSTKINGPTGPIGSGFKNRNELATEIKNLVDGYAAHPGKQNYIELDRLKRAINDKAREYGATSGSAANDVSSVTKSIKTELNRIAPGYDELMDKWQSSLDEMRDLTQGLGIGAKADSARALSKMMRQKDGGKLIEKLAQHDPRIPYMIAGATLEPWTHTGLPGLRDIAITALGYSAHPIAGAAGLLSTMPRLMGKAQYGLGAAQRAGLGPRARAAGYAAYESNFDKPLEPDQGGSSPGIRNNNHGNIKDGDFAKSQPGYDGSDGTFAKFKTPEDGRAASATLLKSYARSGRNTIDKIVDSWTPPGKNSADVIEGKKRSLERAIGVRRNQRLDLSSKPFLDKLLDALEATEVGPQVRAARASGGRILNHDNEAQKLISAAELGLKSQNKTTEPLLGMHDDAVATALKTADRYI